MKTLIYLILTSMIAMSCDDSNEKKPIDWGTDPEFTVLSGTWTATAVTIAAMEADMDVDTVDYNSICPTPTTQFQGIVLASVQHFYNATFQHDGKLNKAIMVSCHQEGEQVEVLVKQESENVYNLHFHYMEDEIPDLKLQLLQFSIGTMQLKVTTHSDEVFAIVDLQKI